MVSSFSGIGFLIFGYGGFTRVTCTSNCSAHTLPRLSARRGLSFSFSFCLHVACDAAANLTLKSGGFYLRFSASNCAIRCHDLLHMSNLHGSNLFHRAFYHHLTYGGCVLQLANLIAKDGSWSLPILASNCDIRCYIWFYFYLASGLSPLHRGFHHLSNHLSVDCGGSIPPIEFWSWISCALTLDGFHCPLRLTNWVSLRTFSLFTCHVVNLPSELLYVFACKFSAISCVACSWLVFFTCVLSSDTCLSATSVHRSDDSTRESPLPLLNTCTHSTLSIDASLLTSACILSIDTCLCATCVLEFDGSTSESPLSLLTICTHSTFSLAACYLFDNGCVLTFATCLDAHCACGLDDSIHKSPLPTACASSTLAFEIVLLLFLCDLIVTESSTDSALIWLFSSLTLLAAMLGRDAVAKVKGILLHLYNSLHRSAAPQDFVRSIRATCTFVRFILGP